MSETTHIIRINEPYVKYKVEGKIHVFTIKMSDLIANSLDHEYTEQGNGIFFLLYNPLTDNSVTVKLKSTSLSSRVYENAFDPEKIIQLIVI